MRGDLHTHKDLDNSVATPEQMLDSAPTRL